MKRIACLLFVVAATCALAGMALADYAHQPPFDPQRTLYWGFDSGTGWETPVTEVGPAWGSLGTDALTTSGFSWIDSPSDWAGKKVLGMRNDTNQAIEGWLDITLWNYDNQRPVKNLWLEYIRKSNTSALISLLAPGYSTSLNLVDNVSMENGSVRHDFSGLITPNPNSETLRWYVSLDPGEYYYLDEVRISTECIPEPGSLVALGSGLIGLAGMALRRRR